MPNMSIPSFENNIDSDKKLAVHDLHFYHDIHRGSYMSTHVLLNLLNEFGKRDKMRGLPSILSLFSQGVK